MGSNNITKPQRSAGHGARSGGWAYFNKHKETYMFLIPGLILVILFCYIPLAGLSVAFLDYNVFKGMASPFVGLENFKSIFTMPEFTQSIWNTALLGCLNVLIKFPTPILFALLLNELKNGMFKRVTQTVSYLPHFISTIAVVGLASSLFSNYGIVNDLRLAFMGEETERVLFLTLQDWFVPMNVGLTVWKNLGWSAVIYLATISGIDPGLYEAAIIDGAGRFKQCIHITIPSILGTVIILLILEIGNLFRSNFDMIYGLQNAFIDFEVISTVVYKQGITQGNYSIATALSLMEGLMSLVLVLGTNYFSKKVNETSIV
ncbi:MAG: sugar ABC transporter permease [Clostridia bacterium]|nr:sugar ABC transporter permease [Clostridia bacterium]